MEKAHDLADDPAAAVERLLRAHGWQYYAHLRRWHLPDSRWYVVVDTQVTQLIVGFGAVTSWPTRRLERIRAVLERLGEGDDDTRQRVT
jgi:hypothetical protein